MEVVNTHDINEDAFNGVTDASLSSLTSEVISSDTAPTKLASLHGRTTGPTRRSTKGGWTEQEDLMLTKAVKLFNGKNWKKIAERFPGRSDVQCLHRWQKVLNPDLVKGPWTKEEDDHIIELVKKYGCKKWSVIAQSLPGRIGKQCRERWHNHLNPAIKKHAWTKEEELALIRAHQIYGNKWAEIAKFLPGRADNSIKNHWNCSVKKKLDSYLASGYTGDLLGINAFDIYNHDGKEESPKGKVSKCDSGTVCSLDQNDSDDGIDTSLGVSVLGVSNRRWMDVQSHSEPVQIESRCLKEKLHCQKESPPALWFECRSPIASGLSSEHPGEEDANCDSTSVAETEVSCGISDESMMTTHSMESMHELVCVSNNSPSNSGEISLSLSISSDPSDLSCGKKCQPPHITVPMASKRVPESPKRPRRYANSLHVSGGMRRLDLDIGCNTLFPSSSSEDFVSENSQGCMKSKGFTTTPQSKNVSPGSLFNEPPKEADPDIFLKNGRFSSAEKSVRLTDSPGCFTPPSHMGSNYTNGSSAETILRTAAKNFKNTPSIIRKRTRATCVQDCNTIHSNGSELRRGSSKGSQDSTHTSHHVLPGQDDLTSTHLLNVKWLSLSSPSLQAERDVPLKSVEKRLEYAFDLEWNNSIAKCRSAAAENDSFNGTQILEKSPGSARDRERSNQTLMLLGFGVNCNSVI